MATGISVEFNRLTTLLDNIASCIAVGDPADHENGRLDDRSGVYRNRIARYAGLDPDKSDDIETLMLIAPHIEGIVRTSNGITYHLKWHEGPKKIEVIFITPTSL